MEATAKAEVPKVSVAKSERGGSKELHTFIRRNPNGKRLRLQENTPAKPKKRKVDEEGSEEKTDSKKCFSFFRDDEDAKAAGYLYRRMWVADVPMLMEGKGLKLVQRLGLEEFFRKPIPNLNKRLCDEFISTYDATTSCGRAGGREVKLDADSVMRATGLPSGSEKVPSSCHKAELRKLLSDSDLKTSRGFNVIHLVNRDDLDCLQAVAGMLMMKLEARKECFQFATGEVLVALDKSLSDGLRIDWAQYLTRLMLKATAVTSKRVPSSSIGYQYGEWLTRIIENSMNSEEQLTVLTTEGNHDCNDREEEENQSGASAFSEKKQPQAEMQLVIGSQTENWMVPFEDRAESGRMIEVQDENLRLQRELQEAEIQILELERKRDKGVGLVQDVLSWLKKDMNKSM